MSKILSLKYHLLLFWLISLFTGFLFAVVIDSNAGEVMGGTNGQFIMPTSKTVWLIYCCAAYLFQAAAYGIIAEIAREEDDEIPILLFWSQFFVVIVWLGLYFGLHLAGAALITLFVAVFALIFALSEFRAISLGALLMMIPYCGLICFLLFMNIYTFFV